jgi:hypothetical protein
VSHNRVSGSLVSLTGLQVELITFLTYDGDATLVNFAPIGGEIELLMGIQLN